jgi:hypothetical protein
LVLVDESAEEVAPLDAGQSRDWVASSRNDGGSRIGRPEIERVVRPSVVVGR